jgi:tetratricopeptide (TPR) repeat protein
MAAVETAPDTGGRLRTLLQRATLSPEQLARRLNRLATEMRLPASIDPKTPYKWLRGSTPRQPWPALVSAILSQQLKTEIVPADLGWRGGNALHFVPADSGMHLPWTGAGAVAAALEVVEANVMDRRVFVQLSGAALTQPALAWLLAPPAGDIAGPAGRRVLDSHVDSIDEITAQLRRMDDQFGGGVVLEPVKSQVRFVLDLLRNRQYTSTVGLRLHGAAAELLRLAGWVSWDAGQNAQGQRFWIAALRGAHSAGDKALGGNILGFMSDQAKDVNQVNEAVQLAEAATKEYPGASPRVSAMFRMRVAIAYARASDRPNCVRAIDAANDSLRGGNTDSSDPAWSYWFNTAQAEEQIGWCYSRLGDWPAAQDHLTTAIRLNDGRQRREEAIALVGLAGAHVGQGEPEQACQVATRAVEVLTNDVDSDRCLGRLRHFRGTLAPYRKVPAVREFQDRTAHLLDATQLRPAAS